MCVGAIDSATAARGASYSEILKAWNGTLCITVEARGPRRNGLERADRKVPFLKPIGSAGPRHHYSHDSRGPDGGAIDRRGR